MIVLLHAGQNDQSQRKQINETVRKKKTEDNEDFSKVEHKHNNTAASLDYAHAYYKCYIAVSEKHPSTGFFSQQRTKNTGS